MIANGTWIGTPQRAWVTLAASYQSSFSRKMPQMSLGVRGGEVPHPASKAVSNNSPVVFTAFKSPPSHREDKRRAVYSFGGVDAEGQATLFRWTHRHESSPARSHPWDSVPRVNQDEQLKPTAYVHRHL